MRSDPRARPVPRLARKKEWTVHGTHKDSHKGTTCTRWLVDSMVAVGRCNAATGRHLAVSLPTSTLDSIQCHSISQCNAHAAAYRCTAFRNETTAVSTGTSLLSVPHVIGPPRPDRLSTVHQDITRIWHASYAFTQILFFSYTSLFIHSRNGVAGYLPVICSNLATNEHPGNELPYGVSKRTSKFVFVFFLLFYFCFFLSFFRFPALVTAET